MPGWRPVPAASSLGDFSGLSDAGMREYAKHGRGSVDKQMV
jgi:hypothetical protein